MKSFRSFLKKKLLLILTVLGIILGFVIGFLVRLANPSKDTIVWLGFPGEMFLNMLKMPIIPLVSSSIISATATMGPNENGKIGAIAIGFTVVTNFVSTAMGLMLALLIKPGSSTQTQAPGDATVSSRLTALDLAADMIRNLLPGNLVRAALQKQITTYVEIENEAGSINSSIMPLQQEQVYQRSVAFLDSTNVLGLIFCSVAFGLATAKAGEKGLPFLKFFQATLDIVIIMLKWFLWVAPIGIMSLIAASIAAIDDLTVMFLKLGLFVASVCIGLIIHQMLLLPLVYLALVRSNPFRIHVASLKAWCMAFAAASSAGAMPYMFIASSKLKIPDKVSSLVITMGVTFNANGSSIFISAAILFLSQLNGIALDISSVVTILFLVSLSSMALPAVPSASIVLIVILATMFGIPAHSVGVLFAVEWFLDRFRTTGNVLSEMFALAITWHFVKKDFNQEVEDSNGLTSNCTLLVEDKLTKGEELSKL